MPKISAVMALYNTPVEYLKPTVESILNQSFKDFEFIIIDDASSFEYETFFNGFKDERIKYFKLDKNSGPGHARNEGTKRASGEYIAIVDSDDIYLPKRFEAQSKFLDENPDTSLIGCTFRFSNRKKMSYSPLSHEEITTFMLFNSPLANPAVMIRKDKFIQNNLFYPEDINFAEDYELWTNAMFSGVKIANLEDFLMIYTRRKGQLSRERQEKQTEILKRIYKNMFSKLGLDATEDEINLHYNISLNNFSQIENPETILDWFDKIIEQNKSKNIFDEKSLIKKRDELVENYKKIKNRLFKVKIGGYNLCLSKNFTIYLEERD